MDYMPEYDGPNPNMYDKNPCRCGSTKIVNSMHMKDYLPRFRVYCHNCGRTTRSYLKFIDAVHKWNKMNEREDAK